MIAGITVGVMLIPQSMAYAILGSLPPIMGLYTGTMPPIIYSFFGTSKHLAVGPAALVSLFFPKACDHLGLEDNTTATGKAQRLELAPVLAFYAGVSESLMVYKQLH